MDNNNYYRRRRHRYTATAVARTYVGGRTNVPELPNRSATWTPAGRLAVVYQFVYVNYNSLFLSETRYYLSFSHVEE